MFKDLFEKTYSGCDLTMDESRGALLHIMQGSEEPALIGAFLTALHMKGETANELAGFALAMREQAIPVPVNAKRTIDTCGTGGDKKYSFNISTLTAFVLAGCGIPVVKHGNRASSSSCGSADLLEALGVRFRLRPDEAAESLERTGFAFLFAPDYHPATMQVAKVRKQLGTPTLFNLLGPLTNPARPSVQLIGVYNRKALELMAEAALKIDQSTRLCFVHTLDGWDEATPTSDFVVQTTYGHASTMNASIFGLPICPANELTGGTPKENAYITMTVLDGEPGSKRDAVILNAALAIMAYDPVSTPESAVFSAASSLDSGSAKEVLIRLQQLFPGERA